MSANEIKAKATKAADDFRNGRPTGYEHQGGAESPWEAAFDAAYQELQDARPDMPDAVECDKDWAQAREIANEVTR